MTSSGHSYGPTCSLHSGTNLFVRRASTISDLPPRLRAQFFYTSALPIDDPLSPLPALSTSSSSTSSKVPPRPFSVRDNAALEEAWQKLQRPRQKEFPEKTLGKHEEFEGKRAGELKFMSKDSRSHQSVDRPGNLNHIFKGLSKERTKSQSSRRASAGASNTKEKEKSKLSIFETASQISTGTSGTEDESRTGEATHLLLCDEPDHVGLDEAIPIQPEELAVTRVESDQSKVKTKTHRSPSHRKDKAGKVEDLDDLKSGGGTSPPRPSSAETQYGSSPSNKLTTGTPFLRAPSRDRGIISSTPSSAVSQTDGATSNSEDARPGRLLTRPMFRSLRSSSRDNDNDEGHRASPNIPGHSCSFRHKELEPRRAYIPVGVSRLHLVELPDLQMKPIYWSPVNDISTVIRGTWSYKDNMLPVEPEVAAQLEDGYIYNKPWTQTWQDELNSCVEAGAEGEAKAVHRLWPDTKLDVFGSRPTTGEDGSTDNKLLTAMPATPQNKNRTDSINAEGETEAPKKFPNSGVIYVDATDAQILQPSLLPSLARGRTPLAAIRKGRQIGIAVVRGFDYKAWEKLHPPKRSVTASKAQEGATASQSGTGATTTLRGSCEACSTEEKRPEVTDLVLVIHGIGQKLSERVESFNFTHAINDFRRQVNVELGTDVIRGYLRDDLGGIMVLPINWRTTLTFDDGQSFAAGVEKNEGSGGNQYTLKDITPETIPAVRNLISDVMLDIPYYLSHHKPRMIQAVIKEANRVYRLWCRNNPGFEKTGKVHLIAHSLGSVMALDILSKQPTKLPQQLDLQSKRVRDNMFEFDTKNLFLCGSPAGFFLLLNKATLIPRKGREKAGYEDEIIGDGIAGDVGTYGCLAVDNIYNIMHYNDPIAYRLNAAVDTDYAASLHPATVPSFDKTLFQSLTTLFRPSASTTPSSNKPLTTPTTPRSRPTPAKLPSNIELETHDFSRESLAETRMYLLNDNGQIDFYLRSGGGPLEIQYLNMLGAHSSYWTLRDFVRLVVLEVGRGLGREGCLGGMRAVKRGGGRR